MSAHPLLTAGITDGGVDMAAFQVWYAVVHQTARECGGRVVVVLPPDPGRNYHRARITTPDAGPLILLLHGGSRLTAAVEDVGDPNWLVLPFREVPRPDLFAMAGFAVLPPAELERPLTDDLLTALSEADRRDIAHHNPPRVGDVVFNWFD